MALLDDINKKLALNNTESFSPEPEELTSIPKANSAIAEKEKELAALYYEIGKQYVVSHRADCDEEFKPLVERVTKTFEYIKSYRERILVLKGVILCEKCGAEIPNNVAFCSNCGTASPAAKPKVKCACCGSFMDDDVKFCTVCGRDMSEPVPEPKRCSCCGSIIKDDMAFCTQCGTPADAPVKKCPNCSSIIKYGMAFCAECGTKIEEEKEEEVAEEQEGETAAEHTDIPEEQPVEMQSYEEAATQDQAKEETVQAKCSCCGAVLNTDFAFCTECGTAIKAETKEEAAVEENVLVPDETVIDEETVATKPQFTETEQVFTEEPIKEAEPEMQKCVNCGNYIEKGFAFCTECGTPVNAAPEPEPAVSTYKSCPNCGAILENDMLFCTECGTKL